MTAKPHPTDLTDAAWDCIKDLLPQPQPGGRHRELAMRAVVHAMFSRVDGGIKWHMQPHEYPQWPRVYGYFSQGRDSGDWQRMQDPLRTRVRQAAGCHQHPTAGCLDRQSVKPTELGGERGDASGTKGQGRQRHLRVDTLGLRMTVRVTEAAVAEPARVRLLLARLGGACTK